MSKLHDLLNQKKPPAPEDLHFSPEEQVKLFWKCKGLLKSRSRDTAFWEATNEGLSEAYEKLYTQEKELASMYKIIKKDLELAASIQKKMLPRQLPRIQGYTIAAVCKMAMESGGDFYDVLPLGREKYLIVIGDVSGKGLPASLYMSSCINIIRTLVESICFETEKKEVLIDIAKRVNKQLFSIMRSDSFVTLYLAILDTSSHTLTYLSAGHIPCILYNGQAKEFSELNTSGIPCGIMASGTFDKEIKESVTTIAKGNLYLMYTDGITEALNKEGIPYEKEFNTFIKGLTGNEPAGEVVKQLFTNHSAYTDGRAQFDDLTIVCFKREA